jgi:sec-independent protein translocase protein TatC
VTDDPAEENDHTPTEESRRGWWRSLLSQGRTWRKRRARLHSEPVSILAHLYELRSRLLKVSAAVLLGSIVAFVFRNWCFDLLVNPFKEATQDRNLVFFRPTEAFSLFMQISLFGGLVLSSPVILYQLWRFVAPALTPKEKRLAIPVTAVLTVLFLGGVTLGYLSLERGLGFLVGFGTDRLDPTIGADHYPNFAMRFLMVFGASFEFPVFLFGLCATGVLNWRTLAKGRRWAIVIIVVGGAIATPSGDPLTLTLLAVPLYVLYETTIWLARFLIKRHP